MTFSSIGKKRRMDRFFINGKTLIVPVDDSLIMGPRDGLKNLRYTLNKIVESKPNAIMGFKGALNLATNLDSKLPFIYNLTASTILCNHTNKIIVGNVESLLSSGVDGVAAHINFSSRYELEQLKNLSVIANDCDKYGLPLLVIAYPRKETENGTDYNYEDLKATDEYTNLIAHAVRVAEELGADMIKTFYSGTRDSFKEITSSVNVPVIAAGGPKIDMTSALSLIKDVIESGGAGICFGRNIFNSENIPQIISKAHNIIFEDN